MRCRCERKAGQGLGSDLGGASVDVVMGRIGRGGIVLLMKVPEHSEAEREREGITSMSFPALLPLLHKLLFLHHLSSLAYALLALLLLHAFLFLSVA